MTQTQHEDVHLPVRLHPDDLDALIRGSGKIRKRRALRTNTYTLTATNPTVQLLPQANNRLEACISAATAAQQSFSAEGQATDPAANGFIANIAGSSLAAIAPAGTLWQIQWTVSLQGTVAAGDAQNMKLIIGTTTVATAVMPGAAGDYAQQTVYAIIPSATGANISVVAVANASGASVIYAAQITATPVTPGSSPVLFIAPTQAGANAQGGGSAQVNGTDTTPFPVNTTDQVWVSAAAGYPVTVSVTATYEEDE